LLSLLLRLLFLLLPDLVEFVVQDLLLQTIHSDAVELVGVQGAQIG
jgi:hypothetical protein